MCQLAAGLGRPEGRCSGRANRGLLRARSGRIWGARCYLKVTFYLPIGDLPLGMPGQLCWSNAPEVIIQTLR